MFPEWRRPLDNARGFGLIAAMFVVVIMAVFGLLLSRYTTTTQVASAEDYLWAQALYSAESVMRLNILSHDQGGGPGGMAVALEVEGFATTILIDTFTVPAKPSTIRVKAHHPVGISRTVEAKYKLQ